MYEAEQRDRLAEVVKQEGAIKADLETVEELWMEQQESLEMPADPKTKPRPTLSYLEMRLSAKRSGG